MTGVVPPVTLELAVPLAAELQSAFVDDVETESVDGCVTVVVEVAEHPFASVTITEYEPAVNPERIEVVAPLLQL